MELPAPGKINLNLRVLGARADGMHRLVTRFQFIELADALRFELTRNARIARVDRHRFNLPEEDLIVRAAKLLQTCAVKQNNLPGVVVTLDKKFPPGGGLGGGSSNAATTLLALNYLWRLNKTRDELAAIGLQLGADVPMFIHARAGVARGVGELITPQDAAENWLCIVLPDAAVSTARVFDAWDRAAPSQCMADNELESIACNLYPPVGDALACFNKYLGKYRGARGKARMSGSGAAVYAAFDSRAQAMQIADNLPRALNATVTRARNRHPLLDFPKLDSS